MSCCPLPAPREKYAPSSRRLLLLAGLALALALPLAGPVKARPGDAPDKLIEWNVSDWPPFFVFRQGQLPVTAQDLGGGAIDGFLRLVITRLPFQSPGHPLTQARMQRLKEQGRDPFADHSLPEAILKFRQGFGRLIRGSQDRGTVLLLDPRVRTKGYGRRFLQALPFSPDHDPTE